MTFAQLLEQFFSNAGTDDPDYRVIYITKKQAMYLARLRARETESKATIQEMRVDIYNYYTKFTPIRNGWKLEFLKYNKS